jgi:deazaflavin-dependent oxidoreductase (nitroreductase family)
VDKLAVSTKLAKYVVNPLTRSVAGYVPLWSLLETVGRKSGLPRRTPIGNGLEGNTFWLIAEHGHRASYVRNIKANPKVRVRVGGRWRNGTAHLMPEDDARARQRSMRRGNAALVRVMGTDLLTVRIDLDD